MAAGLEVEILQGFGAALIVSEGFTAPDLPEIYRRAHEVSRGLLDPDRAIPALAGLWNYHVSRAEFAIAAGLADDLLRLAPSAPAALQIAAHNAAGMTKFFLGEPRACVAHLRAAEAVGKDGDPSGATALLGENPHVVRHHYAACVHQLLGDPDEAERQLRLGHEVARALDQPFGMAQVHWSGAVVARAQGDPERVLARARSITDLCWQAEIDFWFPAGDVMAGWARIALGDRAGLAQIRAGIAA